MMHVFRWGTAIGFCKGTDSGERLVCINCGIRAKEDGHVGKPCVEGVPYEKEDPEK